MKKHFFTALKLILFVGLGVFLIWLFLHKLTAEDKKKIFDSFIDIRWLWLVAAAVIGLISHIFRTLRWNMLINTMGYKPLFANSFMAVMIGYFANLALPRLGEVVRCSILFKYDKVPVTKSFGTVVTERAIDLFTFLFFFIITILLQLNLLKDYAYNTVYMPLANKLQGMFSLRIIIILVAAIIFITLVFIFILRKRISHLKIYIRITEMIKGFWLGLKSVAKVKSPLLFIVYSILIWVCYLMTAYVAFFALKGTSGLGMNAALASLSFGTIGIMVIQGGIGIYPIIISETLSLYSIDKLIGYGFGWLAWSLQTAEIIIGGLLSLVVLPVINKKKNAD